MNSEQIAECKKPDLTPAKRCPDYDEDCVKVPDHWFCWTGGKTIYGYTPPAEGYCPFCLHSQRTRSEM